MSLRIAITADPEIPVPPRLYGGIERIVEMLVNGLVDPGHEVTLLAHRDSNLFLVVLGNLSKHRRHLLSLWLRKASDT